MLLTKKQFFCRSAMPVKLYYATNSGLLQWHSHEFSEIAIMLNGEAVYETDCSSETIVRGDVVIIPPMASHRYVREKNVSLMNLLFVFDKLGLPCSPLLRQPGFAALFCVCPDYYRRNRIYPKLHLEERRLEEVKNILMPAWKNQEEGLSGAELCVYGAFLQLIPILLDSWDVSKLKINEGAYALVLQALDKMSRDFREPICIANLASEVSMSESTFSRHFKAAMGMRPMDYVLKLRLQAAIDQLRNGNSVTEAAYASGFSDSNYFSRLFRKKFGCSPRQFLKGEQDFS